MDSEKNEPESEESKENKSDLLDARSNIPTVPNYDAIVAAASVRRSPRAPARVKVNFNDVLNGEAGKKKRSASAGSTSSNSNGSESSPVAPVISGPKKTDDGREIDMYCWLCHKVGEDSVSVCIRCPRVFHFQCLGPTHRFNEKGLCPECKLTSTDGTDLKDSLTADKLAELLPYALNRMLTNAPALKTFKYSEKESRDLVRPMDLSTLLENIREHYYKTTPAFLSDVKWIFHNLMILHGPSHSLSTNAKKLVSICRTEMFDIEACPDCYEHAYSFDEDWFCKLCSVNHTIVWAKLKGFPFWPSKVVKVIDGIADVRFFGSHEKGKVPVHHCFRLSKGNPNDKVPKNVHFKKALEELETYTESVHKKFGPIIYYPTATVYDPGPENINTKQVTRKRDQTSSGLALKSKKLKTLSTSAQNRDPVVELDKLSEATVRINIEPCGSSAISSFGLNKVKTPGKQTAEPHVSKRPIKKSDKVTSDVNKKSALTTESSAADKSLHKKNFMKHLELNTISPQGTSEVLSEKCNGLPLTEVTTKVTSTNHSDVNSTSSVECVEKSIDDNSDVEKTAPESSENLNKSSENSTDDQNTESVNVNSNTAAETGSSTLAHLESSNTVETSVEDSAADSSNSITEVTMSEENNGDVVMSGDNDILHETPSCGEKEVPSIPNTFASESRDDEVMDTVCDVLDSLEFFEETPAVEQADENVYIVEPNHIDLSGDHDDEVEMISPQPSSSNVMSNVPRCNEVHGNRATDAPRSGPSNEDMDPIFIQQSRICVQGGRNPQDQGVCCIPLPEGLSLEKYQNKVYSAMRATVEEIWHDYVNTPNIQKIITALQKEIDDLKAKYHKEMKDISDNTALVLKSVESQKEKEKAEALEALRKKCEEEKEKAIMETKQKQWCSHCGEEAKYYCCWNTCYCGYPCQEAHWAKHMASCSQSYPYDEHQQSPKVSELEAQRSQESSQSENARAKKFGKETYSKQQMGKAADLREFDKGRIVMAGQLGQSISKTARLVGCSRKSKRSRGSHTNVVSSKSPITTPFQSPPPFVTTPQRPPNYVSNVIPNSVPVMAPPHIRSVGPTTTPFVSRLPPPPPPTSAPNRQPLPFVSGQHPHQSQNAPHYQTANSQGSRMHSPVLPPRTSFQPRQYFSPPSTSKLYMGGPRDVRYPAKPYM